MRAMDFAKRTAAYKVVDYLCADPEHNMAKTMDRINKICPTLCSLPSARHSAASSLIPPTTCTSCSCAP